MKKIISILLSLSLMVGLLTLPATATQSETTIAMQALGIMVGDENGNMNLSRQVTRAQFATMAVRAALNGENLSEVSVGPFPDVAATHWSAAHVDYSAKAGLVKGYTDGTFRPDDQISLAEGITVVLRLLGYTESNLVGSYPHAQMTKADQLGLLDEVGSTDPETILTRQQSAQIFYNALSAPTAGGQPYLMTLGYALDMNGDVDLTALVNGTMEGPVIATGDWTSKIDLNLSSATIVRDNKTITSGQIGAFDAIYWNEGMNTLWVYSDRVTGTIQTLTPSSASPTAVMVAGQTYPIGNSLAAFALSQVGDYRIGDSVTLILGRDGTVVGVTDVASSSQNRVGVVTAIQKSSYDGGSYTADSITILATDGKYYSYPANTQYFDVGDLARVTVQTDGSISVTRPTDVGLSGTISQDGTKLDKTVIADNVQILDTYDETGSATVVYPSRLAGVTLSAEDIRYSEKNEDGELSLLILDNVTGDLQQYVLITDITTAPMGGLSFTTYYSVIIGSMETVLPFQNIRYTTDKGPAVVMGGTQNVQEIRSLSDVELSHVSGNVAYDGTKAYPMADDVIIYEKDGADYYITTLERASDAGLELTGYYDNLPKDGGRIRIIIAE